MEHRETEVTGCRDGVPWKEQICPPLHCCSLHLSVLRLGRFFRLIWTRKADFCAEFSVAVCWWVRLLAAF